MLRRVDFYTYLDDPTANEVRRFLEAQDFDVRIHDLQARPLGIQEITKLMRHFDTKHFINQMSKAFKKFSLDKITPTRKELIAMMAEDNELIRKPIIVAGRLMTVGCNRQKIIEMLQIKANGSDPSAPSASQKTENGGKEARA
jgi:arsenate reductase-like glutaredoxin family protein